MAHQILVGVAQQVVAFGPVLAEVQRRVFKNRKTTCAICWLIPGILIAVLFASASFGLNGIRAAEAVREFHKIEPAPIKIALPD